ncbi:MAG: PAS domain S-box protein [Hylemonella sp.]
MKSGDKERVLIVDDKEQNLQILRAMLSIDNYQVELASDGPMALRMVRQTPPDLILLDVVMPGMDGHEVCRQLKAEEATQNIPVIFVTGKADVEAETRALAEGAADYLVKPLSLPIVRARVRTQLALHRQRRSLEGMFRDVIEFAPDAFILADSEGRIVQVNAQAESLFGCVRSELLGQPVELLLPPRLRAAHTGLRMDYASRPRGLRTGVGAQCLRKDGTEFPGDISLSPLQTHQGRFFMALVRDVTERQRQEAQLREAARHARSLIETSIDPLVLIDLQGKVQDANEAACQITGLSREQLIGSDAPSRFTEPEKLYEGYKQVMTEGQALNYQLTIKHASGRTYDVLCNAKAFRNEQGEVVGLFATAHDVTESRRIQQEVSVSRQRLREMAAQGEAMREHERKSIAREVHDELGQVLTALRMDLTFLELRHGARVPELKDKIQDMRGLVDRAIQGVRDVASNLRPTVLDMGLMPAIHWLCDEFRRHTDIPCQFEAEAMDDEMAEDRAIGLFRIVQESLTNITRYAQATEVQVSLQQLGGVMLLKVRDNGRGFDPAQAVRGKSFGLLGMQERALALGGTLEISSAPGQGATIGVTVPLHHTSHWQELS